MALSAAMVLSGLSREHFTQDSHHVFVCGEVLLKSPRTSSVTSVSSSDSGISSISAEDFVKNLDHFLDIITDMDKKFKDRPTLELENVNMQIKHENRNLLNLTENLRSPWPFQFSRTREKNAPWVPPVLNGSNVAKYFAATCTENDCGFIEPI